MEIVQHVSDRKSIAGSDGRPTNTLDAPVNVLSRSHSCDNVI